MATVAKRHRVPVICLSGGLGEGAGDVLSRGIDALAGMVPGPMTLERAMEQAAALLEGAAERACRLVRVGMRTALVIGSQPVGAVRHSCLVQVGQPGLPAVGPRQPAQEMVEGPVLHHHDDNVVDAEFKEVKRN
jgi:hypothetical protein